MGKVRVAVRDRSSYVKVVSVASDMRAVAVTDWTIGAHVDSHVAYVAMYPATSTGERLKADHENDDSYVYESSSDALLSELAYKSHNRQTCSTSTVKVVT